MEREVGLLDGFSWRDDQLCRVDRHGVPVEQSGGGGHPDGQPMRFKLLQDLSPEIRGLDRPLLCRGESHLKGWARRGLWEGRVGDMRRGE